MKKKLELFKGLFQPFTNLSVFFINNNTDFIESTLEEVVKTNEGKLNKIDFIEEKYLKLNHYMREFEYIVLGDIINKYEKKELLLQKCYRALENSANIIILENKTNNNLDEIRELLDKTSFVAINSIELFDNYELITAKKLHMWGSGL
ncbi:hypothetical protein [Halarcobacter sp.]|uniref:hypothetical protein n=1 Tax=Halarcobacter sp. TaxID=2321133 RepID=UPI0029F5B527|nr:hypothetical protein [Halarcobacter sp.]